MMIMTYLYTESNNTLFLTYERVWESTIKQIQNIKKYINIILPTSS